jgi:hypothetical protein
MKKKEAEKKKKDFLAAKAPAVVTRITSLFGCRYPLILPGMSWISRPELVALEGWCKKVHTILRNYNLVLNADNS